MSILRGNHCDTCRWWGGERAHEDEMPVGTCRAFSPKIVKAQVLAYHDPDRPNIPGPIIMRGEWPWTTFDDFCGMHSPKPVK